MSIHYSKPRQKGRPKDYFEYVKSERWKKRKEKYHLTHKRQCVACGSFREIDIHHLEYGDWGYEKDTALITLCHSCHDEYHRHRQVGQPLESSSLQFIRYKQECIKRALQHIKDIDSK